MIDRRILIADDDSEVRLGAADLLAALGLVIEQAGTASQALSIVRRGSLHLALLDVHLPDGDGMDVFAQIRSETPELPCILWSGDATEALAAFALRSGAAAFLHKPVQPQLLRGEVRRVLDARWGPAG